MSKTVGSLACQLNSNLRKLVTKVVSCAEVSGAPPKIGESTRTVDKTADSSIAPSNRFFEVVCEDSVLFPEGGGQPCDLGTINGEPDSVISVVRRGDVCVLKTTTTKGFSVGEEVVQEVDWPRRQDHMEHHTGQHLLTAVVERELQLPTECWGLTHPACYIQVPAAKIPEDDVRRVERICNDYIMSAAPVNLTVYGNRNEVPASRSRGIPADVNGPIRMISLMENNTTPDVLDSCLCCGTHVGSLGGLTALHLLHQEAKGNTCRLFFVTGERAKSMFTTMYARERTLQKLLAVAPGSFADEVKRRSTEFSETQKAHKKFMTELSVFVAEVVAKEAAAHFQKLQKEREGSTTPAELPFEFFYYHREDVDIDFIAKVGAAVTEQLKAVSATPSLPFIPVAVMAAGSLKSSDGGQFMVFTAAPDVLAKAGSRICEQLEGKGGASKQGFRGKGNLTKWKAMVKPAATGKHKDPQ